MHVVYLTWGETPRSYGIYRSQVAETIAALQHLPGAPAMTLIAGLPLIHSGLVRERFGYTRELATLRRVIAPARLRICLIPTTQNFVNPTRRSFALIFLGARRRLAAALTRADPDIVHCRSFLAAHIACALRRERGLRYRVVYDARSLWPEMQFRLRPDAATLKAFKAIEHDLLADANAVVSVNAPMAEHYKTLGARRSEVIHLAADMPAIATRDASGPDAGEPLRLLYMGALHAGGMQDPEMLFLLYARARQLMHGAASLSVITTSAHAPLSAIAEAVIGADAAKGIDYRAVRDPAEMPAILRAHHLACNVYKRPKTENDRLLTATGFSTKSAEYLAAGLPILVSPYPKAICDLVRAHDVGLVLDEARGAATLTRAHLDALLAPETRRRATALAGELFARHNVARQLKQLYEDLAG